MAGNRGEYAGKAGALNQVLSGLLDDLGDNDCVMVVDADTVLDPGFLAAAAQRLTADRAIMSIGGLFYGDDTRGLLAQFQRNEYVRYRRELERRRGRVYVLTGTASIFRSAALRAVADARFRPSLVRSWAQQLGIGYSVIALSSFWLLIGITVMATPDWVWYPFWLGIGGIFVIDRVVSVWEGGGGRASSPFCCSRSWCTTSSSTSSTSRACSTSPSPARRSGDMSPWPRSPR